MLCSDRTDTSKISNSDTSALTAFWEDAHSSQMMRDSFAQDHRLFSDVTNLDDDGARPDSLQQLFDSQMQEPPLDMDPDLRQGSPCQLAASELMVPGSFGAEDQTLMGPSMTPTRHYPPPRYPMHHQMTANFGPMHNTAQQLPSYGSQQQPRYNQSWSFSGQQAFPQQYNQPPNPGYPEPYWSNPSPVPFQHGLPQRLNNTAMYMGKQGQGYSDQQVPGFQQQSASLHEQNCLDAMMQQAQSVGLWGGSGAPHHRKDLREIPEPGARLDMQPQANSSNYSGVQEGSHRSAQYGQQKNADQNPIDFYQREMEHMLPPASRRLQGCRPSHPDPGVGFISRKHQLQPQLLQSTKSMPRLQPVSLGMTTDTLTDILTHSQQRGMNDGPFRPPTRLPPNKADTKASAEKLKSLLHQSKMQLSLGLAAGSPINLHSWSYGEESKNTGATCVGSGPADFNADDQRISDSSAQITWPNKDESQVSNEASAVACGSNMESSAIQDRQQGQNGAMKTAQQDPLLRPSKSSEAAEPRHSLRMDEVSRAECLQRYQAKKRRRHLYKTIRYHKRKVNADNRPRFKGRFVKSQGQSQSAETGEKGETVMSDQTSNLGSTAAEVGATTGEAEAIGNDITEQNPGPAS